VIYFQWMLIGPFSSITSANVFTLPWLSIYNVLSKVDALNPHLCLKVYRSSSRIRFLLFSPALLMMGHYRDNNFAKFLVTAVLKLCPPEFILLILMVTTGNRHRQYFSFSSSSETRRSNIVQCKIHVTFRVCFVDHWISL